MRTNYRINSGVRFQMLSQDQLEEMFNGVLHVLETIGLDVHHEEAREILKDAGAWVEGKRVRIPQHVVKRCLATAPRSFTIYARDGNPENDQKELTLDAKSFTSLPFTETFNVMPPDWEIRNHDNNISWTAASAPSDTPSNTAAYLNFFSYKDFRGEYDYLITPALDLTNYTDLSLSFDVAYAPFSPGDQDGLIV